MKQQITQLNHVNVTTYRNLIPILNTCFNELNYYTIHTTIVYLFYSRITTINRIVTIFDQHIS